MTVHCKDPVMNQATNMIDVPFCLPAEAGVLLSTINIPVIEGRLSVFWSSKVMETWEPCFWKGKKHNASRIFLGDFWVNIRRFPGGAPMGLVSPAFEAPIEAHKVVSLGDSGEGIFFWVGRASTCGGLLSNG